MVDLLLEYWNDAITLISFVIALIIGYYQIKHYRAQRPRIEITDINDPSYIIRTKDEIGSLVGVNNLESDDLVDSYYTVDLTIENPGREDLTISKGELHVSDTEEQLEMLNHQTRTGLTAEPIRIDAMDSQDISFRAVGTVRDDEHPKSVECRIVLKSPAANISDKVMFDRRN